ncbi:MAG: hypothetical protein D6719_00830, partial [Candidatus Dadabacteria bacterium]
GYILLTSAIIIIAILSLVALLTGAGFLLSNQARFQKIVNFASLAAMEEFSKDPSLPYRQRAQNALNRANELLAANRLPGISGNLGDLNFENANQQGDGTLKLGMWYRSDPDKDGPQDPCNGVYPCFKENTSVNDAPDDTLANAIRIEVSTDPFSSPLVFPFCKLFGRCAEKVKAQATAAFAQRCTAFVIDASLSTYSMTHNVKEPFELISPPAAQPPDGDGLFWDRDNLPQWYFDWLNAVTNSEWWKTPDCHGHSVGPFTGEFKPEDIYYCAVKPRAAGEDPLSPRQKVWLSLPFYAAHRVSTNTCHLPSFYTTGGKGNWEQVYYCNTLPGPRPAGNVDPKVHYRSDYGVRNVGSNNIYQQVLLDQFVSSDRKYWGPQPYSSYFLAINAALRSWMSEYSAGDRAMLTAFAGKILGSFPERSSILIPKMTDNLAEMVQLTNLDNRGTFDRNGNSLTQEIRPNFLDYRLFSLYPENYSDLEGHTNIILAFNDAIKALNDSCPASAKKVIVIASDWIPTCALKRWGSNPPDPATTNYNDFKCGPQWYSFSRHIEAMEQLASLHQARWYQPEKSVLNRLIEQGISVVAIAAGEHIGLNFRNAKDENGNFINNFYDLYSKGFYGFNRRRYTAIDPAMYDFHPLGTLSGCDSDSMYSNCNKEAFRNAGAPLPDDSGIYQYRWSQGVAADMAIYTNGVYCPLMPPCADSEYVPVDPNNPGGKQILKDEHREQNTYESCALYKQSMAEQAAECVIKALKSNPYLLVAEDN